MKNATPNTALGLLAVAVGILPVTHILQEAGRGIVSIMRPLHWSDLQFYNTRSIVLVFGGATSLGITAAIGLATTILGIQLMRGNVKALIGLRLIAIAVGSLLLLTTASVVAIVLLRTERRYWFTSVSECGFDFVLSLTAFAVARYLHTLSRPLTHITPQHERG